MIAYFILYVQDQQESTNFYSNLFLLSPRLNVPGMTEFQLSETSILGLMPENGIKNLIGAPLPDPSEGNGIPRSELYVLVEDVGDYYLRALNLGAKPLSSPSQRDWGHLAAYCLDRDGHVIAFAKPF